MAVYTRIKKLTDASYSPTTPASESAIRTQIDGSVQEVLDLLNVGKQEASNSMTTDGNQTITGIKTFNTSPLVPAPVNSPDVATKGYVDTTVTGVVLGQVPDGSITDAKLSNATGMIKDVVNTHLADYVKHCPYIGTTAGTNNDYTITAPGLSTLISGVGFGFMADRNSSGNCTINPSGLGAKSLLDGLGNAVTNLKQNVIYQVRYNGTNFISLGKGGGGTATKDDIALSKTATVDSGLVTGTGVNAKRRATGTGTAGTTGNFNFFASGLGFTPSLILATYIFGTYKALAIYDNGTSGIDISMFQNQAYDTPTAGGNQAPIGGGGKYENWSVGAGYFSFDAWATGATIKWVAYE